MARLAPINIGPVRIETPVILAPMTGVTDLPFRRVVKRYGAGLIEIGRASCRERVYACV